MSFMVTHTGVHLTVINVGVSNICIYIYIYMQCLKKLATSPYTDKEQESKLVKRYSDRIWSTDLLQKGDLPQNFFLYDKLV